jgi:hypothetical protein
MTVEVIIRNRDAREVMEVVAKLRQDGWQQGQDFDFYFQQSHWDGMTGTIPSSTKFVFYTEKYASIFALKYAS